MITIEEVTAVPELEYTSNSVAELKVALSHTPLWSPEMWLISATKPLFVCGVYWPSIMTPPEFWVLLCRTWEERPITVTRAAIRLLPRLLDRYPHIRARAPVDDRKSRRLIELAGFRHLLDRNGYACYEVKK